MVIKSCTITRNGVNFVIKLFTITFSFIEFDVVKYDKLFLTINYKTKTRYYRMFFIDIDIIENR